MSSADHPRLAASSVAFAYGEAPAIEGVSLELRAGSVLGLVGPNGAGKSTLLRCLHRGVQATAGSIVVDGDALEALRPREIARRIALVPQFSSPGFPFRVDELVAMGRYPVETAAGPATANERVAVRRALDRAGVLALADRAISELSGGEFRKVLIAQALAQETGVLLLDEPLQNLDLRHQLEVMELVRELAERERVAVATVLHDLSMAARFCDELLLLDRGRAVARGTPEEVLTRANLQRVYGIEADVRPCAATGRLEVVAVRVARAELAT